jgi:HSP20 family protein
MAENPTLREKGRGEQSAAETTRAGVYFTPRVDIYETDAELTLYADVPGVRPEDVDLRYERGELMLHARVRPQERRGHPVAFEYEDGDYYRVFQIHETIDAAKIEGECKNGVLTVHLPKAAAAQPRKVTVRGE